MAEGRGQRPVLSRQLVLRTALEIADREGPERLTMRRLGAELGVDPMAAYHYVPNKAALFDGIMEIVWGELDLGGLTAGATWQARLEAAMHELADALRAHPGAVAILGTRPVAGPELFALLEQLLALLVEAGMPVGGSTAELLNAVVNYTVGHVLAEVGEPVGGDVRPDGNLDLLPAAFPHLASVFNSGWAYDPARQYARGIAALIHGWRLVETAPVPPGGAP